jgi:hypothetical protein
MQTTNPALLAQALQQPAGSTTQPMQPMPSPMQQPQMPMQQPQPPQMDAMAVIQMLVEQLRQAKSDKPAPKKQSRSKSPVGRTTIGKTTNNKFPGGDSELYYPEAKGTNNRWGQ